MVERVTLILTRSSNVQHRARTSSRSPPAVVCRGRQHTDARAAGWSAMARTPGSRTVQGLRTLRLGGQDGPHGEIRQAAAERLHRLHLRTGLVVHLAALQGTDEVSLDVDMWIPLQGKRSGSTKQAREVPMAGPAEVQTPPLALTGPESRGAPAPAPPPPCNPPFPLPYAVRSRQSGSLSAPCSRRSMFGSASSSLRR